VLEFKEHCNEHHEKYSLYCKEHECPCCGICFLENHKDCKEVVVLENITKNVKTSTMFNEVEHLIKEVIENFGKIRQNRETNSSAVKEQKRIYENEIQELRTKINNHLDKLQDNLLTELSEAEKQITDETHELQVSLDEKHKKNERIRDKYSQHKKVRVRPTNIYSSKANRKRRRNTRHVFAVISQQR
jgi:DNA repair exonuclease SbcCD ATPase subunit